MQRPTGGLEPVDYIEQARASYTPLGLEPYRWAHNTDAIPLATLDRPLADCRLALIASGGIYRVGQQAFHHHDDTSYRRIPIDTPTQDLRVTHFGYDTGPATRDPNVVYPANSLRRLEQIGEVGELAPHAMTFMGGIYSQRRVREELVPALEHEVRATGADAVVLVPI